MQPTVFVLLVLGVTLAQCLGSSCVHAAGCPDAQFFNGTACSACSTSCKTCYGQSDYCLSCNAGKYRQMASSTMSWCTACPFTCATCASAGICQSCRANALLDGNMCVCNDGYYLSSNHLSNNAGCIQNSPVFQNATTFKSYDPVLPYSNPERGFYRGAVDAAHVLSSTLSNSWFGDSSDVHDTLLLVAVNLDGYQNVSRLPTEKLNDIRQGFEYIKELGRHGYEEITTLPRSPKGIPGLKVIVRIVYGLPDYHPNVKDPASLNISLNHIMDLATVFAEYKNIIAFMQAGVLGDYGEFHGGSASEANDKSDLVYQNWTLPVINALIASTPYQIKVQIRNYAALKYFKNGGGDMFRVGIYDDGLCKDDTDINTWYAGEWQGVSSAQQKQEYFAQGFENPSGGEQAYNAVPSACDTTASRFREMHMTYVNYLQHTGLNYDTCPEIGKRLGYRFELIEAKLPVYVQRNMYFNIQIKLNNTGWSRLHTSHPVFLHTYRVDRKNETISHYQVADSSLKQLGDASNWMAGQVITLQGSFLFSRDIAPCTNCLAFALAIPDANGLEQYAIKFNSAFMDGTPVYDPIIQANTLCPGGRNCVSIKSLV